MVLTLFLIVSLTFFLVQAQPGDYATFYALNPDLPAEVRAQIKASFGLDKPLWEQYLIHMKNTFTGNFGVSFGHFPRPVIEVLAERIPRTAVLFLTATATSFYIGFFLGKAIAWRRGGRAGVCRHHLRRDAVHRVHASLRADDDLDLRLQAGLAAGGQVSGSPDLAQRGRHRQPRLHLYAGDRRRIHRIHVPRIVLFPAVGTHRAGAAVAPVIVLAALAIPLAWAFSGIGYLALDILRHMILPIVTLTLISFAGTMLLTRNSMLETMREDYVMAAEPRDCPRNWCGTGTPPQRPAAGGHQPSVQPDLRHRRQRDHRGRVLLAGYRPDPAGGGALRRPAPG